MLLFFIDGLFANTLQMKQNPKFFLHVRVKPYVLRFLEMNFDYPLDFSTDKRAHKFFLQYLKNPSVDREHKIQDIMRYYTEVAEVVISEHDFYVYGFELTKTDTVQFSVEFEHRAKMLMRNVVSFYVAIGLPLTTAIRKFQKRFEFYEHIWSIEAIKKDFYRHGVRDAIDFDGEIFNKIEYLILRHLSESGTIVEPSQLHYENDK